MSISNHWYGDSEMKLKERLFESTDKADFYFDPKEKMFTKEYNENYISLAVKGMFSKKNYISNIYRFLEGLALKYDHFNDCNSFEDLAEKEV